MTGHQKDDENSTLTGEQDPIKAVASQGLVQGADQPHRKEPFKPDRADAIFALFAFVLGFFFARWLLLSWQGWGVTVFTLGYCGAVTLYLSRKGIRIPPAGWFWLIIVVLTGLSYSLWTNYGMEPWRSLLLFGSAVYWIICATSLPIMGKTSNFIVLDGLNGLGVIPFKNIGVQWQSLALLGRRRAQGRQVFFIALGIFLALLVMAMVFPLLMKADSGGFSQLTHGLMIRLEWISEEFGEIMFCGILAIPIAAYLFGLVAGSAHKRGVVLCSREKALQTAASARILPESTIFIVLGLLCGLYMVFIGSQLPYFFSAFAGERPEGWQVYSEYARSGFFELCQIAAINLSVLAAANLISIKVPKESLALRVLNSLLAILTIVLIATAMSKMVMYIGAYGLSVRRLLPCIFMIFLAIVCGGVIARQKWQFSMARLAAGVGVVMLCLLCLADPDSIAADYNAERYLAGTLTSFDVENLYRSGPAGVDAALEVYGLTQDQTLRAELNDYLLLQQEQAAQHSGRSGDNLQRVRARDRISEYLAQ